MEEREKWKGEKGGDGENRPEYIEGDGKGSLV